MEDELIARVTWKDITFYKNRGAKPDEDWDKLLLRFETIGRIKEKDGILRIQPESPILLDENDFYTMHEPMVQLVPIDNVEEIEILKPIKKKNKGT